MKANFLKVDKKNRHYTPEQLEKIERSNARRKIKRGRRETE